MLALIFYANVNSSDYPDVPDHHPRTLAVLNSWICTVYGSS